MSLGNLLSHCDLSSGPQSHSTIRLTRAMGSLCVCLCPCVCVCLCVCVFVCVSVLTEVWHMAYFWVFYGRYTIPGPPMGRSERLPRRWAG